ncbi:pseudouridine synthase [Streptococcus ictaluri]|uniref:Pseudouridine synthase n=1 Tax=Streptococcus ictaluri 707-05 TaxID=764299 RepID=G5K659_9STRE|nr:pseudouridine synthase [Streptococcus ictaluri]EHI68663.1 pseudouridylate synthase [Streptococcus ictaluri 707-05]
MRLDKFLADADIGSRSQVKELLKKKQILVNGTVEKSPKYQVDLLNDQITYQGQHLSYEKFVYYMLNKPAGFLSATEDANELTVIDLLDDNAKKKSVFPVGRLDKDTHGLLLLTNNGQLAHELLSPKKHVSKDYVALVSGIMTSEDQEYFAKGISLKDHHCLPARLEILSKDEEDATCRVRIQIKEGKFHQVKRMVAACGKKVIDLQRITMWPLVLDSQLAKGQYRPLSKDELRSLSPCCDHL